MGESAIRLSVDGCISSGDIEGAIRPVGTRVDRGKQVAVVNTVRIEQL
jgi:hypothetical protein